MKRRKNTIQWTVLLLACGALGWFAFAEDKPKPAKNEIPPIAFPADGRIDFEKHVQPILVAACYECHSAKKIKGKFRLDAKELAMKGGSTGVAIMPGKGESSYLVKRLRGEGDEDRMPLDHDPLTDEQIRIIETWIDQGAVWPDRASVKVEKHWAYVKPVRPELPKVKNEKWARNGIDYFVLARLEKEGLSPSPEADKEHLLRRVSLDLTGLPPSPEEVSAFLLDERPDAYERAVDRLLDSPHYGERWGRHWLDIARYADSNGYEKDAPRVIWAYRDWVINALNRDLPFDQFIIEQFAGDMLPDATPQQRIATGFHRNTMINEEGGIDVEEFRDKAIVDRVQTTATGLLGLTLQCANCHDHKYDQFSQKEYYQFWALLNNADEPVFNVPDPQIAKRRAEIEAKIAQAESELESKFPAQDEPIVWEVVNADDFDSAGGAILSRLPDNSLLASGRNAGTDTYTVKATINPKEVSHIRLEALTHPSLAKNGPGRAGADGNGNFVLTEFRVTAAEGGADVKPVALVDAQAAVQQSGFAAAAAIDGNPQTGWAVDDGSGKINENRTIIFKLKEPIAGEKVQLTFTVEQTYPTHPMGRFKLSLGRPQPVPPTNIPVEEQRKLLLAMRMEAWEKQVAPKCVKWTVLEPTKFSRNYGGSITKLNDNSLLFTGDNYYRDEYKLEYQSDMKGITVLRLEVLPHEDQPKGGPGRDPEGGFVLSEFAVNAGPVGKPEASQPVEFEKATAETATPPTIQKAIDGKRDTHWIINPRGDAKPRVAVFRLKTPIGNDEGTRLAVSILQNYHQQANLGRVRISATTDTRGVEAAGVPGEIEEILITPADQRSPAQLEQLKKYFLTITPLLAEQRKQIANLKNSLPKYVTTLVLQERPVPRVTKVHHRGDFLNQREAVEPGVPGVLPTLPEGAPKNRLTLAKWLVDENHPLVGRVVMNRI
ncbi:MAG TPA: DUF1549 domain-containing protein, partial [Tepidisphaeraceae bacterium]|nr:DUF1549 domain-containing protein [Tepidisphaeraceae bacterium]